MDTGADVVIGSVCSCFVYERFGEKCQLKNTTDAKRMDNFACAWYDERNKAL